MKRTRKVQERVDNRVINLCMHFEKHLDRFHQQTPFTSKQLTPHQATLQRRNELGTLDRVLHDGPFFHNLRATLRAWDMDQRMARLGNEHDWLETFSVHKGTLARLWDQRLDDPNLDIEATAADAWAILRDGQFMQSKSQLVGGAMVLHHLLPYLIPPINGEHTCGFFHWEGAQAYQYPWEAFLDILGQCAHIAQDVNPKRFVATGWNSSPTKVIDNAIIGFQEQA